MDPQQCMALEVAYSTLEDGGFTKDKMKGTNTGVYVGKPLSRNESGGNFKNKITRFLNFLISLLLFIV
jgi:hypothetical protein